VTTRENYHIDAGLILATFTGLSDGAHVGILTGGWRMKENSFAIRKLRHFFLRWERLLKGRLAKLGVSHYQLQWGLALSALKLRNVRWV
jgi:hypothetical protein